jgi:hypothetical protein
MDQERQGKLRPEMADWYPGIDPEVWYPARELAERVIEARRGREPTWELESRVPCDEHFVFRGGHATGRPPGSRTRRDDRSTLSG